jgi:hypothetical protein
MAAVMPCNRYIPQVISKYLRPPFSIRKPIVAVDVEVVARNKNRIGFFECRKASCE